MQKIDAAERKSASKNWYNAHAVNLFSKNGYWQPDYDYTLAVLKGRRLATLLDLGCGTGAFLACAAKALPDTRLFGMDLSQSMVQVAAQRLDGNAQIIQGDAEKMPLGDACVEAVTCNLSIHHYPHAQAAVDEMYRILKPGGVLCINDMDCAAPIRALANWAFPRMKSGDVKMYCRQEIEAMLRQAGFEIRRYGKISPFTFLCVAVKPAREQ